MPDNLGYFAGLRGTGSYGADERPKSFREMILWMNPNGSAPLFALTSKAKTEKVNDPEFSWWEEVNNICRLNVTPAIASTSEETFVVSSGAYQLIVGDVLQIEPATQVAAYTPEFIRVLSVASDTSFEASRGAAGTTAANVPNNAKLTRVGNAQSEAGRSVGANSTNPVKFRNYCQIFKTPAQVSKSDLEVEHRTGDPRKNEHKRKSFVHSEKLEQALFWGIPYETVDASNDNKPLRFTGGLRNFITSHRTVFTADPTEDQFLDALYPVFDYDAGGAGNERILFMGNKALNTLNKLVKNADTTFITYNGEVTFFGMKLQKYTIPQGTLYLKSHPLMNVHPVYTSSIFCVNPSGIIYRPLGSRDTKLQKDIQENDADYVKDQWLTEAGFEFHFERTFAYIGEFRDDFT